MQKTAIVFLIALAASAPTVAVQASLQNSSWYTGAQLGWSQYYDTGFYGNSIENYIESGPIYNDRLGVIALLLGYQKNPFLKFELGYGWLGHIVYKDSFHNGAIKSQGISLAATLNHPIIENMNIYARIGGMAWRADSKVTYESNTSDVMMRYHDTGVSPLVAVGLEYTWMSNFATRLDYQWINNIGDVSTIGARPDNALLSLGMFYHFDQNKITSLVQNLTTVPVVQTEAFTLKTETLFSFDKAVLTQKGQRVLDQLCSKLSLLSPRDSKIIVLGYTDRIGSHAYNQILSQVRAQNVVSYLISKGIPSDKISARAMGTSNPVTGNTCNKVKTYEAMIDCLAADRRAEITVQGTKEVVTQQLRT